MIWRYLPLPWEKPSLRKRRGGFFYWWCDEKQIPPAPPPSKRGEKKHLIYLTVNDETRPLEISTTLPPFWRGVGGGFAFILKVNHHSPCGNAGAVFYWAFGGMMVLNLFWRISAWHLKLENWLAYWNQLVLKTQVVKAVTEIINTRI